MLSRQRTLGLDELRRWALEDHPTAVVARAGAHVDDPVRAGDDVEVHTAGTGKEGLEMAEHLGGPDVALVDLRLPDIDGIQVVRDLKARHADTAVIMITAFGHIESAVSAIKNGATDYLEKPFQHLEKLRISVSRALDDEAMKRVLCMARAGVAAEETRGVGFVLGEEQRRIAAAVQPQPSVFFFVDDDAGGVAAGDGQPRPRRAV